MADGSKFPVNSHRSEVEQARSRLQWRNLVPFQFNFDGLALRFGLNLEDFANKKTQD